MSKFGFNVEFIDSRKSWHEKSGWLIYLPHQCDEWNISQNGNKPVPKKEAIEALETFIVEAQEALASLKKGQ